MYAVPLAVLKNRYIECEEAADCCKENLCTELFDEESGCSIKKSALDRLVLDEFGEDDDTVRFLGPGDPASPTYYRLEYGGESPACDEGNCRGPHYCSEEVADAGNIWGDFCPYVHTGDNAGKYRHPHLALAALETWIANQCMVRVFLYIHT